MIQTRDTKLFFKYVFPSILSFALSGVYAIVDGFFVGNSLGDVGLSAVNIAYPIVAFIQAVGTGIGMGGAIYYSINKAEKKEKEARMFTAGANWLMIAFSVILTVAVLCWYNPLLRILGASGTMLSLAEEYIVVVTIGTILQIFGTGLVPLIRNLGGSFYAMIAMMAGRELTESYPKRMIEPGEEVLRVEHLTGNGDEDISFNLRKGEILGFAGLVGAGRTELMRVIYGANPKESGKIFVRGREVNIKSCSQAIKEGIGLIPEDRKNQGVFLRMPIRWNIIINNLKEFSNGLFVSRSKENKVSKDYEEKLRIKTPSLEQRVGNLSGGNQQKVVIAKTLAANSNIIIFDEPTRGIDVGAKQEIYKLMNELVESGHSIIMVSSDMPELLGMSDRIVVIYEGHKTGEVEKSEFDQNYILDLASGGKEHGSK